MKAATTTPTMKTKQGCRPELKVILTFNDAIGNIKWKGIGMG